MMRLALKVKLKLYFFRIYFFKILLWGFLASRTIFILNNLDFYFANFGFGTILKLVSFWDKGLSFWGGVIGIAAAFVFYAKRENENIMKWMDVLSVSISSSMIFGYLGAFFHGINYGKPTNLPWGITLENIDIPYTTPIHPVQIYGVIFMVILTIVLIIFLLKRKMFSGGVMFTAIISYSVFRFLEEFFRGNDAENFLGLRFAQWITICILVISLTFFAKRYNLMDKIKKI